jgi:hypothetical protein
MLPAPSRISSCQVSLKHAKRVSSNARSRCNA